MGRPMSRHHPCPYLSWLRCWCFLLSVASGFVLRGDSAGTGIGKDGYAFGSDVADLTGDHAKVSMSWFSPSS
jgi:hypothetical protein